MALRIQILATLATLDSVAQLASERAASWTAEGDTVIAARFTEAARFNTETRKALSRFGGRADKVAPFTVTVAA